MHDLNDFPAQALPDGLRHARHIEAALSGGLDSVVLLHLLARLAGRLNIKLTAVHVHHGLQDEADGWLEFCRDYCARLAVPLRWQKVDVVSDGLGIEAAARQARYRVFGETEADVLAAAHHADDQVETFMLAALRGGGLRALSAMPAVRPLNRRTLLWRPLLPYGRAELEAYAERHKLAFVCDPSNESGDYLRNWLRNDGLPQWRARLPQLDQHILSGIGLLQDELAVLEETAAADEAAVQSGGLFDAARWRTLPPARRRQVLRRLLAGHGVSAGKAALYDFERILMNLGQGGAEWKFPQQTVYAAAGRLKRLDSLRQQAANSPHPTRRNRRLVAHVRREETAETDIAGSGRAAVCPPAVADCRRCRKPLPRRRRHPCRQPHGGCRRPAALLGAVDAVCAAPMRRVFLFLSAINVKAV